MKIFFRPRGGRPEKESLTWNDVLCVHVRGVHCAARRGAAGRPRGRQEGKSVRLRRDPTLDARPVHIGGGTQ